MIMSDFPCVAVSCRRALKLPPRNSFGAATWRHPLDCGKWKFFCSYSEDLPCMACAMGAGFS